MLVLHRKRQEAVLIRFGAVTVRVLLVERDCRGARLGFEAPPEVLIDREEVAVRKIGEARPEREP